MDNKDIHKIIEGLDVKKLDRNAENFGEKLKGYMAVNGIQNDLYKAIFNGLMQTGSDSYIQAYNPEHGFLGDILESAVDVLGRGFIKSGNVRDLNQVFSLSKAHGNSLRVASHSQGAAITNRALEGLTLTKKWWFQNFGAPMSADRLDNALTDSNAKNKQLYMHKSYESIALGFAKRTDPVATLGGNWDSAADLWNGLLSLTDLEDHSGYTAQGDFDAGEQPLLKYSTKHPYLVAP